MSHRFVCLSQHSWGLGCISGCLSMTAWPCNCALTSSLNLVNKSAVVRGPHTLNLSSWNQWLNFQKFSTTNLRQWARLYCYVICSVLMEKVMGCALSLLAGSCNKPSQGLLQLPCWGFLNLLVNKTWLVHRNKGGTLNWEWGPNDYILRTVYILEGANILVKGKIYNIHMFYVHGLKALEALSMPIWLIWEKKIELCMVHWFTPYHTLWHMQLITFLGCKRCWLYDFIMKPT